MTKTNSSHRMKVSTTQYYNNKFTFLTLGSFFPGTFKHLNNITDSPQMVIFQGVKDQDSVQSVFRKDVTLKLLAMRAVWENIYLKLNVSLSIPPEKGLDMWCHMVIYFCRTVRIFVAAWPSSELQHRQPPGVRAVVTAVLALLTPKSTPPSKNRHLSTKHSQDSTFNPNQTFFCPQGTNLLSWSIVPSRTF